MKQNKKYALLILICTCLVMWSIAFIVVFVKVNYQTSLLLEVLTGIVGVVGAIFTMKTAFSKSSK
ncbi:hypothetical protein ACFGVS_00585 [Mucilaginibacter sp. AW1-7]|uniref:hypothetical protein n=1 Tax=Mucilaginibacter sp. AW1-7 TaxID=3349874 RepID=UPI003F737B79